MFTIQRVQVSLVIIDTNTETSNLLIINQSGTSQNILFSSVLNFSHELYTHVHPCMLILNEVHYLATLV